MYAAVATQFCFSPSDTESFILSLFIAGLHDFVNIRIKI